MHVYVIYVLIVNGYFLCFIAISFSNFSFNYITHHFTLFYTLHPPVIFLIKTKANKIPTFTVSFFYDFKLIHSFAKGLLKIFENHNLKFIVYLPSIILCGKKNGYKEILF